MHPRSSPSQSSLRSPSRSKVTGSQQHDTSTDQEALMLLQAQLDSERRKVGMLESELKLALAAAQQAELSHQQELAGTDADRKRLLTEQRALMDKLTTVEMVEDSVKELYIQMKDRTAEDGTPSPEQLAAEKAALAAEPILVVLGALHAQLKSIWAFKVEAETDLSAGRAARSEGAAAPIAALRAQVRRLEGQVRAARQDAVAAQLRAEMAEESLAAVQQEASSVATAMSAQHTELLTALKAATSEAHTARRTAAAALEEGAKRDTLVLANKQLESARHFDRVSADKELRRLQAAHEVQLKAMHSELNRVHELMARNSMLEEQLAHATQQVKSLKQSSQAGRIRELEAKVKTLEARLACSPPQKAGALSARDVQRSVACCDHPKAVSTGGRPPSQCSTASPNHSMSQMVLKIMNDVHHSALKSARNQ